MFFRDVIGHQAIKERLIASVQAGRVSHAQLFLGVNGTGSLPLALAYAQYVNCRNPQPEDSCGQCDACRMTMHLEYPDLHFSYPVVPAKSGDKPVSTQYIKEWRSAVLDNPYLNYQEWMQQIEAENRQGNITAEECRDIIRKLSLKPLYQGFKILLMWMPEFLGSAGNILLKILEEPPAQTLFILVAENEELILPTILSRTQMLRVPRIAAHDLTQALADRLGLDKEEAMRIAYLSDGNYNTALRLFKEGENDYTAEFIQWLRDCYAAKMGSILQWVDKMATTGRENQKNFLLYGLHLFRECLLYNQKLEELNKVLESEKDFVQKFSALVDPTNIQDLSEAFSKAHYYIERNANPKILLFNLSLQINDLLQQRKKMNA